MKVLTVGGALIDTIAVVENDRIERITMQNAQSSFLMLEEGRKTEASDISTFTGGGAINTAVCMARLGHDVATLIKLGQDQRADTILKRLDEEGISARFASRDPRAPTGASVLLATHERNAAIFTFRGANTLLEEKDLKPDAFAADLVYIAGLSNQSADQFPKIIELAKAGKASIATNPGIRQLTARWEAFVKSLPKIDILSINRTEAESIVPKLIGKHGEGGPKLAGKKGVDVPDLAVRGLIGGDFHMSLGGFFKAMLAMGPKWLVITDGQNGAYLGGKDGILHCPVLTGVTISSTAGAGDAFASTLSAFLAEGSEPDKALLAATTNAGSVVSVLDTQSGLLKRDALMARLKEIGKGLVVSRWEVGG